MSGSLILQNTKKCKTYKNKVKTTNGSHEKGSNSSNILYKIEKINSKQLKL